MPDDVNGTGDSQPADDIRSALAAAIATSEETAAAAASDNARAEPKPDKEKPAAETKPEGDAAPEADAATKKPAADAKTDDATKPEGDVATETKPADDKAAKADADKKAKTELTGKWSAADKATFAKLPAEGQELILRRHKEMEANYTRKTQEIAGFRKEYEPVEEMFKPWTDKMKAAGFTKASMIQAWGNVEQRLMNPTDAPNVVAGIIKSYKIDPDKVLSLLGIAATAGDQRRTSDGSQPLEQPKPNGDATHIQLPPEVEAKLARLDKIEGRLNERDQRDLHAAQQSRQAAEARVMTEIEQFKSAEDGKGNPLHPHFDEVEEAMTHLAAAAIAAKKPVPPLQTLYETAVAANPDLRAEMIAAQVAAQREKDAAEARAKAVAARKASSSVTGAPGSGPAPRERRAPERTLREELEANAADASAP